MYYTSSLVDLWNQIEEVQKRMSMLHTYDSLEEDLFGNVLGDDKENIIISDGSYLGKGASHNNDVYAMEQVQLSDIPVQHDSTVGMNHIKLNDCILWAVFLQDLVKAPNMRYRTLMKTL